VGGKNRVVAKRGGHHGNGRDVEGKAATEPVREGGGQEKIGGGKS